MVRLGAPELPGVWPEVAFRRDVIFRRLLFLDVVICNSPGTVAQAFVEQHEAFQRKSPPHRRALEPLLGDGLFVSDGALWRERRRVVAPVTHAARLPLLAPAITEAAAECAAAWARQPPGQVLDVLAETGRLTAEIICRAIFGRALGRDAAATVVAAFAEYQRQVDQTDLLALLRVPGWVRRRRAHAAGGGGLHACRRLIADILEGGARESSLIRAMASEIPGRRAHGPPPSATRRSLFMAGPRPRPMSWLGPVILSQEPAQRGAAAGGAGCRAGWPPRHADDLPNLPFCRAVVEETMRLYPPVPFLSREAIAPGRIANRPVRKGAVVLVSPWLLHRRPQLWDQPDAFVPDRFMPGAPRPSRHAYIPFSVGPRVCTGMQLGLAEAVICLATLMQAVELELVPGTQVMPVARLTAAAMRCPAGLAPPTLPRIPKPVRRYVDGSAAPRRREGTGHADQKGQESCVASAWRAEGGRWRWPPWSETLGALSRVRLSRVAVTASGALPAASPAAASRRGGGAAQAR